MKEPSITFYNHTFKLMHKDIFFIKYTTPEPPDSFMLNNIIRDALRYTFCVMQI
ncbi:hypothetical protein M2459_001104 [Parabacteroides sp. PF5-5]|nr:hypothetical protein [Parabacteroides sp. PH5-39]MDH6315476.1 hypothetical protein [Parabacteroides sp. PF5-13]MDH6319030.1 hypothetical protein [Parabacteroides sp. PH5-13]MDH6322760.1 hypothetical protein [Parabacteroides sp. PH5-8]MDH6326668.1 hypothetical protein [Parabacteroides sp. PH5-41]MDH6334362.1 hypothetical protein [Parabacteroides sp. PF5-5]MDH6345533.1 hypothetical protein [Parabacteroides sp. PH5-46]MDH6360489.1 hypothetical protein [Parabacteroides sp. PH5-16]MDH6376050.